MFSGLPTEPVESGGLHRVEDYRRWTPIDGGGLWRVEVAYVIPREHAGLLIKCSDD